MLSNYESGLSEPTLGVIRKLSIALSVSADALVFGGEERVAPDESLRMAFEATSILDADEQEAVRIMLEGFLARHQNLRGGDGPRTRKSRFVRARFTPLPAAKSGTLNSAVPFSSNFGARVS